MRVFVGIQMRRLQPGIENATDLAEQFFIDADLAESYPAHEQGHGSRKRGIAYQYQMSSDIERRMRASQAHGVVESGAGSHQSCRGQDALAVSLDDALVDVARKAEVVGVDDEFSHV